MQKSIETTGKTIELAIKAALDKLGLDRESVSVEVLENAKSGFFGIGAVPAKIRATYEAPDEEIDLTPKPALSSASRNKKPSKFAQKQAEKETAQVYTAEEARKSAEEAIRKSQEAEQVPKTKGERPRRETAPAQKPARREQTPKPVRQEPDPASPKEEPPKTETPSEPPAEPKTVVPAEPGSIEEQINNFLNGLMEHMGAKAQASTVKTADNAYQTDLIGEDMGMLIGRRGDTLDAIQHLTNYAVNRGGRGRIRVTVDAENYRQKREESLVRLGKKVAAKVVRYRRNITLEPMNAYERHVIHAALEKYPDVTTYSVGTEPNRRIVVAYSRYKSTPSET